MEDRLIADCYRPLHTGSRHQARLKKWAYLANGLVLLTYQLSCCCQITNLTFAERASILPLKFYSVLCRILKQLFRLCWMICCICSPSLPKVSKLKGPKHIQPLNLKSFSFYRYPGVLESTNPAHVQPGRASCSVSRKKSTFFTSGTCFFCSPWDTNSVLNAAVPHLPSIHAVRLLLHCVPEQSFLLVARLTLMKLQQLDNVGIFKIQHYPAHFQTAHLWHGWQRGLRHRIQMKTTDLFLCSSTMFELSSKPVPQRGNRMVFSLCIQGHQGVTATPMVEAAGMLPSTSQLLLRLTVILFPKELNPSLTKDTIQLTPGTNSSPQSASSGIDSSLYQEKSESHTKGDAFLTSRLPGWEAAHGISSWELWSPADLQSDFCITRAAMEDHGPCGKLRFLDAALSCLQAFLSLFSGAI